MDTRYKVVSVVNNKLYSMMHYELGKMSLEYKVEEWVETKVGGILVFEDQMYAFSYKAPFREVWKTECEEEIALPNYSVNLHLANHPILIPYNFVLPSKLTIEEVWENKRKFSSEYTFIENLNLTLWPNGTKAYKKIKLVEKIA